MSSGPIFSGALPPKKKSELQQIATHLDLESTGTKEDLQTRIKKHLDDNKDDLEDHPVFAGLYATRRKRSVQPPASRAESKKVIVMNPIRESTPKDNRDVSMYLKSSVFSPGTPSSLPPLPDSADASMEVEVVHADRSIIDHLPLSRSDVSQAVQRLKEGEENALRSANEGLVAMRTFLSNSRNIWTLTSFVELLYILFEIIPWQPHQFTVAGTTIPVSYPPMNTFGHPGFIPTLRNWFLPTVLLPALIGTIISFSPAIPTATQTVRFDPLTASIIRLALQFAFNPATPPSPGTGMGPVYAQDVLGLRMRALTAAVNVAFAFAEAIKGAPAVWAKELFRQEENIEVDVVPLQRALTTEDTIVDLEE